MSAGTVLITGATAGLGRALALELARRNWAVLAHGRDHGKLAELRELAGGRVRPVQADLSSLAAVNRLATEVMATTDELEVLVNNAAVGFGPPNGRRQISDDGHELRIAVNYLAPVLLSRRLLPLLKASAPARIVNVGSIGQVGFDPRDLEFTHNYDGVVAYRRSKLALAAHTFNQAPALLREGVTVNCVHPASFMDTAMVRESQISPLSTVADGSAAVLRAVEDMSLAGVAGEFFIGTAPARAIDLAYSPTFQLDLLRATELALTQPTALR